MCLAAARAFDQAQVESAFDGRRGPVARARPATEFVGHGCGQVRDRAAPALALVELTQREVDIFLRRLVYPRDERGFDIEAAFPERFLAVAFRDVPAHVLGEVGRALAKDIGRLSNRQRARAQVVGRGLVDDLRDSHGAEHLVAPGARDIGR